MGAFTGLMETQSVNILYIILDIVFLAALIGLLIYKRRYQAVIIGLCGGIFYFLADYFLFYQLMGVRQVEGGIPVWTILWNTMSVGFSMMAWIWLLLDQDEHSLEWSVLFVARWLCVALLSRNFGSSSDFITLSGGIWQFMGVMALLLLVGYGLLIFNNLKEHSEQIDIKGILMVGILVQFSQLLVFMLSGIVLHRHCGKIVKQRFKCFVINLTSLLDKSRGSRCFHCAPKLVKKFIIKTSAFHTENG